MSSETQAEYLTVQQAAARLGVSVSTIRRWIADRRLPAFRLGPKALRVKQQDVDAAMAPQPTAVESRPLMRVVTDLTKVGQLTDAERARGLAAFNELKAFREKLLAKRGGKLFSDSTEIIRSEREKRSRHLEKISLGSAKYRAAQRKVAKSAKS